VRLKSAASGWSIPLGVVSKAGTLAQMEGLSKKGCAPSTLPHPRTCACLSSGGCCMATHARAQRRAQCREQRSAWPRYGPWEPKHRAHVLGIHILAHTLGGRCSRAPWHTTELTTSSMLTHTHAYVRVQTHTGARMLAQICAHTRACTFTHL